MLSGRRWFMGRCQSRAAAHSTTRCAKREVFHAADNFRCDACSTTQAGHVVVPPALLHGNGIVKRGGGWTPHEEAMHALEHIATVHGEDTSLDLMPSHVASLLYHALHPPSHHATTAAGALDGTVGHLIIVETMGVHYPPALALALHKLTSPALAGREDGGGATIVTSFTRRDALSTHRARLTKWLLQPPIGGGFDEEGERDESPQEVELRRRWCLIDQASSAGLPAAEGAHDRVVMTAASSVAADYDEPLTTQIPLSDAQVERERRALALQSVHDPARRSLVMALFPCYGPSSTEHCWHYYVDIIGRLSQTRARCMPCPGSSTPQLVVTVLSDKPAFGANLTAIFDADPHLEIRFKLSRRETRS